MLTYLDEAGDEIGAAPPTYLDDDGQAVSPRRAAARQSRQQHDDEERRLDAIEPPKPDEIGPGNFDRAKPTNAPTYLDDQGEPLGVKTTTKAPLYLDDRGEPLKPAPPAPTMKLSPLEQQTIAAAPPAVARSGPPLATPPDPDQMMPAAAAAPEQAVAPPPIAPAPGVRSRTGTLYQPTPLGTMPVLDAPAEGIPQIARGVKALAGAPAPSTAPLQRSRTGAMYQPPEMPPGSMNAGSDIIEGAMKTLEPVAAGAGLGAPVSTAMTVGAAAIAQHAAQKAVEAVGGSPEAARLAGNIAAVVAGGATGAEEMGRRTQSGFRAVADATREAGDRAVAAREAARTITPDPNVIDVTPVKPAPRELPPAPTPPAPTPDESAAPPPSPGPSARPSEAPAPVGGPTTDALVDELRTLNPADPDQFHQVMTITAELTRRGIDVTKLNLAPKAPESPNAPPIEEADGRDRSERGAAPAEPTTAGGPADANPEDGDAARAEAERLRRLQAAPKGVDVLDTGELQPRLPDDVGAARDSRTQTPDVADVPFGLTSEAERRDAVQPTLREEPEPPPAPAKREPRSVRSAPVEWRDLEPPARSEVRRITAELESIPFSNKNFKETTRQGGDLEVSGRAAGAPAYWDIVGGNAKAGPTFNYTRSDVEQKLRQFIETGKRSVVSDLAVDVARRRLAGDRTLSAPSLPPKAGDAGTIDVAPLKNLAPPQAAVQQRAIDRLEHVPQRFVDEYRRRFDNVVSADNAKELFPDYAKSPASRVENDLAVHRPASALAHAVYERMLQESAPPGRDDTVVFTAGGTGSGKTSSLDVMPDLRDSAHVVYDSTLSDRAGAIRDIDAALKGQHKVGVVFSARNIEDAFRATLDRANAQGRRVTLNTHVRSHLGAAATFEALQAHYADNPNVQLAVVRNGPNGREAVPLADWKPERYNEPDVRRRLAEILEDAHRRGTVSDALWEAVRAKTPGAGGDPAGHQGKRSDVQPNASSGRPPEGPQKVTGGAASFAAVSHAAARPAASRPAPITAVKEFSERDEGLHKLLSDVGQTKTGLRELFAPDTVDEAAGVMAGIKRANLAAAAQRQAKLQRELRSLEVAFDKRSNAENLAFIDAMEAGQIDALPGHLRPVAARLREVLDAKRGEASRRGLMRGYIKHYFPHEWAEPSKVKQALRSLFGRRPLQGKESYRKKRSIPTTADGIAAGLTPVSYNPITLTLRKLFEMDKSITAYDILREGKQLRVAKYVPVGRASKTQKPEGWVRYPDSFGTVYGPPVVKVEEAYDAQRRKALLSFADSLGIKHTRAVKLRGPGVPQTAWGYASKPDGPIATRFGGPEKVIEHEIGHVLDWKYGLWRTISTQLQANPKTKRKSRAFELRNLADLRFEGIDNVPQAFKDYVRKREEKMANLVNAFLHNPDRAKEVAPTSYWALYNLIKERPELKPLLEIQKTRGLVLGASTAEIPVGGLVIKGYYYGPPSAVRLMNNHLAPGLRGKPAYDLYRWTGNFLNQLQLGLSAFHLTTTAFNSIFSKGAVALQHASRGEIVDALKKTAEIPFAPFIDFARGHVALDKFRHADVNARMIATEMDAIIQGGGRVGWDKFWHESAPEQFLKALRTKSVAGAARHALPALLESMAKPIMEGWVPRLKIAAFLDLARMELRELGPQPDRVEVRRVLGAAWDSIDNRFGELVYDNLFWHPVLKDAGLATVRALGWGLGTVREVFGAPSAQLRQFGVLPASGGGGFKPPTRKHYVGADQDGKPQYEETRAPWLTNKFAYLVSLLFLSAVYGALYQYAHTGLRPGERKGKKGEIDDKKRLLDFFFPRTGGTLPDGREERAALPTYMKDVGAALHDFPGSAVTAAQHKLHPLWNLLADLLKNEDAFGTEIRNGDDPGLKQLQEVFEHIAREYRPISVANYLQRKNTGDRSGVSGLESGAGLSVAPRYVTQTPAEKLLQEYLPPSHHTLEQSAAGKDRLAVRLGLRSKTPEGLEAAKETIAEGRLGARQVKKVVHDLPMTSLQRGFESLTLAQALAVYHAASAEERGQLWPLLGKKVQNAQPAPQDVDRLRANVQAARALPRASWSAPN